MIKVNKEALEFHLYTDNTSYILKVIPSGHLVNLHYGARVNHCDDFSHLFQKITGLGSSTNYGKSTDNLILDTLKLEVGTHGKGDYREPSVQLKFQDNTRVSDFTYTGYEIINGKPEIKDMPHTFGTDDVKTLIITLFDKVKDVYLKLSYSLFFDKNVIIRSMNIVNGNSGILTIDKVMSMNLDFSSDDFELIKLEGKWIKEGQVSTRKLNKGVFYIDSKKGVSSSNHNPFLCLTRGQECYGFGLIYSGNHQGLVEVSPHDLTRIQMGISPFDFSWELGQSQSFQCPEVIMTYSNSGLNTMSKNFHKLINNNLIPKKWQYKERPILLNNWEATYFDFNERKLLNLAKAGKDLGIELFVLDDGWFGERNDDTSSLGDFYENKKKLPGGLKGLSKKINKLGLDFGIWVEPEMVSVKSKLYEKHPDWAVTLPDRDPSFGRNQLVLDFSNPEVIDYLSEALTKVFTDGNVTYVKWDMNRNFTDTYSNYLPKNKQQEFNHRYVLGLYSLLNKLVGKFPDILFESCSSGGNRFDLGMLYYMPQTWTSDNTDAGERVNIQYGMSLLYPQSTMGAHVSGEPSHQVLRNTQIESRFNVAAFGLLGYEMDVTKLSVFESKVIKKQIEFYKEHRKLLQFGTLERLKSPFEGNHAIWMVSNKEKTEVLVGYYQKLQESNGGFEYIRVPDLNPKDLYNMTNRLQYMNIKHFGVLINDKLPINLKINGIVHNIVGDHYMFKMEQQNQTIPGDQLSNIGILPYHQFVGIELNDKVRFIGDFGSRIYHLKSK